jgi:phospholipid-binding lipoprotein MlaA
MRVGLPVFRAAGLLALVGCATVPQDPAARAAYEEANDPLEPLNRQIFDVNQFADRILFKPTAKIYRTALPDTVRRSVRNGLDNLGEPVVAANNVMQGEFHRAGVSFVRFIFNTTVGVGGLIDFCGQHGWPKENGDFGQTLYAWGVPDGPYLVLPVLGPSNPRDALGMAADSYMDPFRYVLTMSDPDASILEDPNVVRSALDGIDKRANTIDELDAVEKSAVDLYAQIRSLYRQNRAQELRHGVAASVSTNPGFDLYQDPAKGKVP